MAPRLTLAICLVFTLRLPSAAGAERPKAAPVAAVCPANVGALLAPFTKVDGVAVDFAEEKHIALLAKPLANRGRILFRAPDHLVRRVEAPEPSAVRLRQGALSVRDASGTRQLDVGSWGPANVLINSFLFVLRGDVESLRRHYELTLTCEAPLWRLRLVPKEASLGKLLAHLEISGRGATPEVMEMLDGAGDRTVTRFFNEDRSAKPTLPELEAFFQGGHQQKPPR